MRHLGRLVRLILLASLRSAGEIKNKCKTEVSGHLVCLMLLASLISAEKIKNKCKNEASWASCVSHFAYKLNISRGN